MRFGRQRQQTVAGSASVKSNTIESHSAQYGGFTHCDGAFVCKGIKQCAETYMSACQAYREGYPRSRSVHYVWDSRLQKFSGLASEISAWALQAVLHLKDTLKLFLLLQPHNTLQFRNLT